MFGFVIAPGLAKLSPASSGEFFMKVAPRVVRFFQAVAGSTILFGALLAYVGISNGDFPGMAWSTTWGESITIGLSLGIVAFLVGELAAVPSLQKVIRIIGEMQKSGQHGASEELGKALMRAKTTATATVLLLVLTFVFMIAAGFY